MAAGHVFCVQVAQITAHITRKQVLVEANAHRLLAHHLAQFVVLARRRHKQAHRIGIATPERLGSFSPMVLHISLGVTEGSEPPSG